MACSRKHCSGCGSCCNHTHAQVNFGEHICPPNHRCGCSNSCSTSCCSSSGTNGFGLLRDLASPYNRRSCGTRFPFYTGPCGPCEPVCGCCDECCSDCCTDPCCETECDCCDDPCGHPGHHPGHHHSAHCRCSGTSFSAAAPVNLAAGDGVAFRCTGEESADFSVTADGIRIRRAGSYMVIYTVHVPANETVSSRFVLTLNGEILTGSAADITSVADGSTSGHSMHAVVHACANSLLKLVSLGPVSVCPAAASNIFTLSISRMD